MPMPNQTDSPPIPPDITGTLQGLKPGGSYLFEGANPTSVRAIAARLGGFKTKTEGDGVRVWRREPKASRKG